MIKLSRLCYLLRTWCKTGTPPVLVKPTALGSVTVRHKKDAITSIETVSSRRKVYQLDYPGVFTGARRKRLPRVIRTFSTLLVLHLVHL